MMIGFGYITKNFLCMSGGNARDLISIIIPLVDIKTVRRKKRKTEERKRKRNI